MTDTIPLAKIRSISRERYEEEFYKMKSEFLQLVLFIAMCVIVFVVGFIYDSEFLILTGMIATIIFALIALVLILVWRKFDNNCKIRDYKEEYKRRKQK